MSDTKVLIRPPRKIDRGLIYYFKPITSYSTNDENKSGESFTFEKPRIIVENNGSYYNEYPDIDLYFNYHHPNRQRYARFKYGKSFYGHMCMGGLDLLLRSQVDNPKYPLILYNYLSTYNDVGGYWRVGRTNKEPCVICGAPFASDKRKQGDECCELVDKHGDCLDFDDVTGKNPKFYWNNDDNCFIYKGKTYND